MSRLASDFVDALRGWLHDQLGDDASTYFQDSVTPCPGATSVFRFSVTVPASEISDLYLLSKFNGLVRTGSVALTIVRIVPEKSINSQLRHARRDFILHVRGNV